MNLYYMIWVDGIKRMQSVPSNYGQWKLQSMMYMSIAMALNIGMILSIIQLHILGYVFYDIKLHVFSLEKLNSALSFFLMYMAAPLVLNYFLIYRKNRYQILLEKYKYYDGKLALSYLFGTLLLSSIYVFLNANR